MEDDATDQEVDTNSSKNSNQATADSDITNTIKTYKGRLMEELGFANLASVEKEGIEQKLESLINSRIINLILLYLPEDKVADFEKIVEGENQEDIYKFVSENIPDMQDKILQELMNIRDELLDKVKKNASQ